MIKKEETQLIKYKIAHLAKDKKATEIDALKGLIGDYASDRVEVIVSPF